MALNIKDVVVGQTYTVHGLALVVVFCEELKNGEYILISRFLATATSKEEMVYETYCYWQNVPFD